jgi:hypothetical protein
MLGVTGNGPKVPLNEPNPPDPDTYAPYFLIDEP